MVFSQAMQGETATRVFVEGLIDYLGGFSSTAEARVLDLFLKKHSQCAVD